jgi:hypothetical protein
LIQPKEQIEKILPSFLYNKENVELVETLLNAYLTRVPRSVEGDYYAIRLKIMKDEIEPACRLFRDLVPRVDKKEKRDGYIYGSLESMVDAGRPLQGYQAVPDLNQAFRIVADSLTDDERVDAADQVANLRALIDLHRKNCPTDLMLLYYSGEAHMLKQEYPAAEADFSSGLAQADLTDEEKPVYRMRYFAAAFENGNGLKAYAAVDDKKHAFVQLRRRFDSKNDAVGLAQLIDAHRKTDAQDIDLPLWDAEVKWLQHDHAAVVQLLTVNRDTILIQEDNHWLFRDRLARSLGYLKRVDEALKELRTRENKPSQLLLEAVVFAVAGDVAGTETALARCTQQGYNTLVFHNDPDLGPALRSEPFKKLCEKYPDTRKKVE